MDWLDQRREDRIDVYMVPQTNLDDSYGQLEGVELGASSIECGYYTDSRTNGKLVVHGDGWIRGSFLRIVHSVPAWGWTRELGTYLVSDESTSYSFGEWSKSLMLHSMLYALGTDLAPSPLTLGSGAYRNTAIEQILKTCNRPRISSGAVDMRFSDTSVLESGRSRLEHLYALCDMEPKNRLDVDGHGRIVYPKYVAPSSKSSSFELNLSDPRGIVEDGIEVSSGFASMPNRVAVVYRYSDSSGSETVQREIGAYADSTGALSPAARGYTVTDFRVLDELSPQTQKHAQELADSYLADTREKIEWRLKCRYLPIWEGDVVDLVVQGGDYPGRRKCLVKSLALDLGTMHMDLTLKETASGDEED